MTHVHVTEREVGPWRDCSFAAVLEAIVNTWGDKPGKPPATVAEKERLRAAAGLPDNHTGATLAQVAGATEKLYGFALPDSIDLPDLALQPIGTYLVVQGSMGSVPSYWRRWSPGFAGAHSAVYYRADDGRWMWCDPDAPTLFGGKPWIGESMSEALLRQYHRGLRGGRVAVAAAPITASTGDKMIQSYAGSTWPKQVRITTEGDLLEDPGGKRLARAPKDMTYPYVGLSAGFRAVLVNTPLPYADKVVRPTVLFVATTISLVEDVVLPPSSAQDAVNNAADKMAKFALSLKREA